MQIKFHGAVGGQVTGSCTEFYYPRTKTRFLVDCGMVQGESHADFFNNRKFDFDPSSIKFVLLTHAHLDHCGLIPKLYRYGFAGSVLCTETTAEAANAILHDSVNFPGCPYGKQDIYSVKFDAIDVRRNFALSQFTPVDNDLWIALIRSAHLPGAVSISIQWISGEAPNTNLRQLVLSGDLGPNTEANQYQPLQSGLQVPYGWPDYLILESTYGERSRDVKYTDRNERLNVLDAVVRASLIDRCGPLIIPAFAMQRTPDILFDLYCLYGRSEGILPLSTTLMQIDQFDEFVKRKSLSVRRLDILKQIADSQCDPEYGSAWIASLFIWNEITNKLIDVSQATIDRLQVYMTEIKTQQTPPLFIQLESPLARKLLPVWRKSLQKRQCQEKLLYRNKHLTEWLGVKTEEEVDKVLDIILGFADTPEETPSIRIGGIVIRFGKFELSDTKQRTILISSGGMCEGGPVVKHLPVALKMKDVTIAVTGYMSRGTTGAQILDQLGKPKEERCGEIQISTFKSSETIDARELAAELADLRGFYSGHADVDGLCNYALTVYTDGEKKQNPKPIHIFLNHGESNSMANLKKELVARAGKDGLREVASVDYADENGMWFDLDREEYIDSKMSLEEKVNLLLHEQMEIKEMLSALLKRAE